MDRLVVVGASLAGVRAVEAARRAGFAGRIVLIGSEPHLPYDRPPLSKGFLEAEREPEVPVFRTRTELVDDLGVDLELGAPAVALDTGDRVVATEDKVIPYEALVIATGAEARRGPATSRLDGVHVLRTIDDARAVRARLDSGVRSVVVVGAGFIGSEVASAARKRGLDVTVVETMATPLVRAIGQAMGETCARLHAVNGTKLLSGVPVSRVEGERCVERVVLGDGSSIEADLVVVGAGATPATGWLEGSGLRLENGVVCDETLNAGVPGVYAAGDVVNWRNALFGRHMRLEHYADAAEQGTTAARNALAPAQAQPYATVPYFWSDWYDSRIQFVGVPDADQIEVVLGDVDDGQVVALYRRGDLLAGALALNGRSEIMKYRGLIARRCGWSDALEFAARRRARARAR